MLAAIMKQLLQGGLSEAEPAERLYKKHHDRGTKPTIEETFSTLREVAAKYSTVYVVIDALDECRDSDGTRSQLLARLKNLQMGQDVRIMATTRFIPEIEAELPAAMKLEIQASDEDVRRYVAGQTHRLPRCIQRDPALQAMMQDKFVEAVDGMYAICLHLVNSASLQVSRFLLARLHINSLLDKRTVKDVKSTLSQLSKGSAALNEAYDEAIKRIDGQLDGDKEWARTVLSWITCTRRPLTTAELCCALAVERDEAELDPESIPDVDDLLSVCAGLVVVDQESAVIRLVHYSTQEYFERIKNKWNPDAPLQIALTCLTYLSFDVFKTGSCSSDRDFEERLQESKFLDYAAKHWGEHTATVEDKVCALACSFLSDDGLVSSATQVFFAPTYKYRRYSQAYPRDNTGAHLAARFGLSLILATMLMPKGQKRPELTMKDSEGQTLLYLAAGNGHYLTAKLLIDKGAEVNVQGGEYGNALQAASSGGYETVVKLLLESGANVNAKGGRYGNALQAASSGGYETVVKLLLESGANVNAKGGRYGNALYAASEGGHEAIVKLLLEKGTNVNAQNGRHGNALYAASEGGHEAIVKLLLNVGANVNAEGGRYGNALYAASEGGHEAIVKLLLEKGANVNAEGGEYGSALQAASKGGYETTVKLLLEKGANVNAQNGRHGNALYAASEGGHEAIVKLLLEKGAEVSIEGGEYGNALYVASEGGHERTVKLLLEKGANVDVQGGAYGNALQAASGGGHEAIVKLLLDKGANINAQGGRYSNAIQAASLGGYEAIVKLLLEKGANVNAEGGRYGNALQAASEGGHEAIVKLLLESGANINAQGGHYSNVLYTASEGGHETIVKLLLEKGANVNAKGGFHGNALQAASAKGHKDVVKLLLNAGANVNAQGGRYGNALYAASERGREAIVKLLLERGAQKVQEDDLDKVSSATQSLSL
jgi:ankyrin repeat protein